MPLRTTKLSECGRRAEERIVVTIAKYNIRVLLHFTCRKSWKQSRNFNKLFRVRSPHPKRPKKLKTKSFQMCEYVQSSEVEAPPTNCGQIARIRICRETQLRSNMSLKYSKDSDRIPQTSTLFERPLGQLGGSLPKPSIQRLRLRYFMRCETLRESGLTSSARIRWTVTMEHSENALEPRLLCGCLKAIHAGNRGHPSFL